MKLIDLIRTLQDLIPHYGESIPVFVDYEWQEIDAVEFKLADKTANKDRLVIR